MRRNLPLLLIAALGAIGLSGAGRPQSADDCLRGPFIGITATNEIGEVLGRPDARDWGCLNGAPASAAVVRGIPLPPPPTNFCLLPARPNPATGSTRIVLTLPSTAHVNLAVWSRTTGHGPPQVLKVRTLLEGDYLAGLHEVTWDGKDDQGVRLAPGTYRVVFEVGGQTTCGDVELL